MTKASCHYYITARGYQRMRKRLEEAKDAYFKVCASNEAAAEAGDNSVWHDNFAYEENQRQMQALSRKVKEIEHIISRMTLVPVRPEPAERVRIGTRVRIFDEDDGSETLLFIAGFEDGDPAAGRISYNSPLAQALLGKEEGDVVEVRTGRRVRRIEIGEILPPPEEELDA